MYDWDSKTKLYLAVLKLKGNVKLWQWRIAKSIEILLQYVWTKIWISLSKIYTILCTAKTRGSFLESLLMPRALAPLTSVVVVSSRNGNQCHITFFDGWTKSRKLQKERDTRSLNVAKNHPPRLSLCLYLKVQKLYLSYIIRVLRFLNKAKSLNYYKRKFRKVWFDCSFKIQIPRGTINRKRWNEIYGFMAFRFQINVTKCFV